MKLKEKLRNRGSIAGIMLGANSVPIVELLGIVGFDYVLIDLQHTPATWETAERLVRAAQGSGMSSMVRVPGLTESDVLKALDIGAEGIVLPFVRSAGDVNAAVSASRYFPAGNRSICSQTRVAAYGLYEGAYVDLLRKLNDEVFLFGVVEDLDGIRRLPEILDVVPGLDAIAIGRGDLAAGLGKAGQQQAPELLKVVDEAVAAIVSHRAAHCALGVFTYSSAEIPAWRAKGAKVFCHMSEVSLLARAAKDYLADFHAP